MSLPSPYPTRNLVDVKHLRDLGYPISIVKLVYPQFEETVHNKDFPFKLWLHPGQHHTAHRRANGHDVLRELLRTSLLCRAATFHDLRYYTVYSSEIPIDWRQYSYIIGWKGLAYDQNNDMVVPALYINSAIPTIHWIPLSLIMHGGEATLLYM